MGHSASGTAAIEACPAGRQLPGPVGLADMLTLSCLISQTGQTTVTFVGELDTASADQAYGYVRNAIDTDRGEVLLDVAGLSFCDARGLGALVRMSRHAGQAGSPLHLVAPPPLLVKIIRISGLQDTLPVHRGNRAGHLQVALVPPVSCKLARQPGSGDRTTAGQSGPGVQVLARLRRWLVQLLAVAANSPIADGRDTGWASWRYLLQAHWPRLGRPRCGRTPPPTRRRSAASSPGARRWD